MNQHNGLGLLLLALSACGGQGHEQQTTLSTVSHASEVALTDEGSYIDLADYAMGGPLSAPWYDLQRRLTEAFDDVCMDTFCEGDYSNLTVLSWRCSVQRHTGILGRCVGVFAGSAEFVEADSGVVRVESLLVTCPLAVQGRADEFLAALGPLTGKHEADLLHLPLPGSQSTLYRSLSRCL